MREKERMRNSSDDGDKIHKRINSATKYSVQKQFARENYKLNYLLKGL